LLLLKLFFYFLVFDSPLLDFLDLFHFVFEAFFVNFILNLAPLFLLVGVLHLIDLEKFLPLFEFSLLLLKLLPDTALSLLDLDFFLFVGLERLEDGEFVQSGPLVHFVLEPAYDTLPIIGDEILL